MALTQKNGPYGRFITAYRAELTCGHTIKLRLMPMNNVGTYGCTAGMGCGYQLGWVKWWYFDRPDSPTWNRKYRELKETETDENRTSENGDD